MHTTLETTSEGYIINGILRTEADFHNAMWAQDDRGSGFNQSLDGVGWTLGPRDTRCVLTLSDGTKVGLLGPDEEDFIRLSPCGRFGWYCGWEG